MPPRRCASADLRPRICVLSRTCAPYFRPQASAGYAHARSHRGVVGRQPLRCRPGRTAVRCHPGRPLRCHPGRAQSRQVYARCVNLPACARAGTHDPRRRKRNSGFAISVPLGFMGPGSRRIASSHSEEAIRLGRDDIGEAADEDRASMRPGLRRGTAIGQPPADGRGSRVSDAECSASLLGLTSGLLGDAMSAFADG